MSCIYWRSYLYVNDNYYLFEAEEDWLAVKEGFRQNGMDDPGRCYKHSGMWRYKESFNVAEGRTSSFAPHTANSCQ